MCRGMKPCFSFRIKKQTNQPKSKNHENMQEFLKFSSPVSCNIEIVKNCNFA